MKLKEIISQANPSLLGIEYSMLDLGKILSALPRHLYRRAINIAPTDMIATVGSIKLPDDAKAFMVTYAAAVVGTAAKGPLTIDAGEMTVAPLATHCAVTASGDIGFFAADVWTEIDLIYLPLKLDVLELTLPVVAATGMMALPTALAHRIVVLEEASVLAGTVRGNCAIVTNTDVVPIAAHCANMNLAKTRVQFLAADGVTSARVKLGLVPAIDLDAILEADTTSI